jgi:hypothetical protein
VQRTKWSSVRPNPGLIQRATPVCRLPLTVTMSSFLYELPTTGAVSFVDFCSDSTGAYTLQLAEATQARANVRAALKESKRTDGEKDNLGLVKVRALA